MRCPLDEARASVHLAQLVQGSAAGDVKKRRLSVADAGDADRPDAADADTAADADDEKAVAAPVAIFWI